MRYDVSSAFFYCFLIVNAAVPCRTFIVISGRASAKEDFAMILSRSE